MPKKILMIDDDRDLMKLLTMRLETEGYQVDAAFDALQAMTQLKRLKPDLVLLDITMPAGGGINVLKNIRLSVKTFNLPVIVVTGRADYETKDTTEKLGISGYFVKPMDVVELMQKIADIFSKKKKNLSDK